MNLVYRNNQLVQKLSQSISLLFCVISITSSFVSNVTFLSSCYFVCLAVKNIPLTVLRQSLSNSNDKFRAVAKISAKSSLLLPISFHTTNEAPTANVNIISPHSNEAFVSSINWARRRSNNPYSSFPSCAVAVQAQQSIYPLFSSAPLTLSLPLFAPGPTPS